MIVGRRYLLWFLVIPTRIIVINLRLQNDKRYHEYAVICGERRAIDDSKYLQTL